MHDTEPTQPAPTVHCWPAEFLKNENLLEAIGRRQNPDVRLRVPQSTTARPQSREGLVALSTWTHPAVVKQLKQISADTGIKQQRLVAKALNHLFREYSRAEIAEQ